MKVVVVGAGHRGSLYARFALANPAKMRVVGVVEPCSQVRTAFAEAHSIERSCCFADFADFSDLNTPIADAIIICSPDNSHFEQTIRALDMGYNVLLEKPIAQTWEQCTAIARKARERALIVGVCYPLRYHPIFLKVRELLDQGAIGELISINHAENIGIERMVHNFVRGGSNTAERSTSLLLSKSCHDLDYLVALSGADCRAASSYGSLKWFRPQNAPVGSADRCTDCGVEAECPYSAIKIYLRQGDWLRHFRHTDRLSIERELQTGTFGRCVYRAGNDLWDNQVLSMQMENGVSVSFSLNAFTTQSRRSTHLMGSHGEILVGEDFDRVVVRKFLDGSELVFDFSDLPQELHSGADWVIVEQFAQAVATGDSSSLAISLDRAVESHRIAFNVNTLVVGCVSST